MKMLVRPGARSSDCYYRLQPDSWVIETQINLKPNLNLITVHSVATIKNVLWFYQTNVLEAVFLSDYLSWVFFLLKSKI